MDGFLTFLTESYADGRFNLLFGVAAAGTVVGRILLEDRLLDRAIARDRKLRDDLIGWGVVQSTGSPDLVREVYRWQRRLSCTAALVSALALVAVGLAQALAAALGHVSLMALLDGLAGPPDGFAISLQLLLQFVTIVGTGLGYPMAVRQARLTDSGGLRYADLHRRRLTDYRTPAFLLLGLAAIALQAASALTLWIAQGRWAAAVVLGAVSAGLLVAELLMVAIAGVPRMVVTPDPMIARRCDDLLRSQVIGQIQSSGLAALGFGCLLQAYLLLGSGPARDALLHVPCLVDIMGGLLLAFVALVVHEYRGRLGGRVTGWWGKPLPG